MNLKIMISLFIALVFIHSSMVSAIEVLNDSAKINELPNNLEMVMPFNEKETQDDTLIYEETKELSKVTTEDVITITTEVESLNLVKDTSRTVYVNDDKVTFNLVPIVAKDYTLVPYKLTFLIFGAEAEWDKENNKIIAVKDEQRLEIEIGSNIAYYNNKEIRMEVPAQVMDSEVIVPIEWIGKLFNKTVEKEIGTNSVYITL
ncbi:copper amine oxidase N-terminal domain-containing protein [Schinkia azotoformans]|uniref:copper amine oxidase N-terminal domain-containing protein n=1 Tax=Schinkia azotoformans TaxID=1454 RepID=UPI002DBBEA30|nr:copper amine oxidase N-terminal domain-containing protein [Schinkia azotoformans]MEC1719847.1 copper amine oxidase N-terminal domain-containing protein [Schinkia azotoformans]MED4351273.1 copper amine oxidase N-terminal domain-containing protein [Schinkia azotoformans]MED4412585.1 copper amine oxidase N-terminal domain-containing protein [Schinkia azotoformans]